ncbi:MAG: hypothetical protein AB7P21_04460 [Lautropia sp.]
MDELYSGSEPRVVRCALVEGDWLFDYFHFGRGRRRLLVLFPSALVRGKRIVPSFHRWSWAPQFSDADVLCVSDPTLRLDEEILGGWFQGTADDWVMPRVLRHIRHLTIGGEYREVVFCGSSLGGFAALQAGVLAPSVGFTSEECRVVSENPQVSLPRYMWGAHMAKLARVSYGVDSLDLVEPRHLGRLDVALLSEQCGHVPIGVVVVKESDAHHHQVHVKYLQQALAERAAERLRVDVIPASLDASGHTPLSFKELSTRLETLF